MQKETEFLQRVSKFVSHCKMVADNSPSPVYRSYARAAAMDKCLQLKQAAKSNSPMKQIAYLTIQFRDHLITILPVPNNTSYSSSLQNLNSILSEAYELRMSTQSTLNP